MATQSSMHNYNACIVCAKLKHQVDSKHTTTNEQYMAILCAITSIETHMYICVFLYTKLSASITSVHHTSEQEAVLRFESSQVSNLVVLSNGLNSQTHAYV